jgi:GntR family transcriptional regulator/MocR family aminotransferase
LSVFIAFDAPFYQCLEENFKDAVRFKKNGWLAIWLQFRDLISLIQLSEQAYADLFCLILYQDKDTCAIRLGFGHLNKEEIEIVVKKLKQAYDLTLK